MHINYRMIEKYLKLLDNFKEEDIASFLKSLREKFILTLQGSYFSSKASCFFSQPNKEGEPFTNFESQPKQIVQLKQVINALYHAQLAFEDLQSVNLRNGDKKFQDLKKLYYKTIEHGYKASYLLTHLDIDFHELFRSEIQQALQILAPIKTFADSHKDSAIEFSSILKNYPIGHKAGVISGTAIAQMKPNDGNYDYDFLAHFGAVLPGYIHQLTTYIQQYGPQISTYQPTINKAKLDELQEQAFRLLNSIENLQSDDIFISFKALNYIKIIREIISLSMTSLEQIGYANDSSQDVIRHNLRRLKYELLPELFSLADRLEDEGLLNPGTLSQPMMAQIKPLYELMAFYAAKFVDFPKEGEELLTIEDAQFADRRLEKTRQRIAIAHWNLTKQTSAQIALDNFFAIIENKQYSNYSLLNLPEAEKDALKRELKFLLPYVKAINPELSNLIIRDLTSENSYSRNLQRPWHWLTGTAGPVAVTSLIPLKTKLQTALAKERATQRLHIELNKDIISFVENNTDIDIYPYQRRAELNCFDEAKLLGINPTAPEHQHLQFSKDTENVWITNNEALTVGQAETLAHYYQKRCLQLNEAQMALHSFLNFLYEDEHDSKKNINPKTKRQLRLWYSLFQPYLVESLLSVEEAERKDRTMVDLLSEKPLLGQKIPKLDMIIDYSATDYILLVSTVFKQLFTEDDIIPILAQLECLIALTAERAKQYTSLAEQKYVAGVVSRDLIPDINTDKRANFVLKHTNYSQMVAAYRSSLFNLIEIFNTPFREKLKDEPPFPEIVGQKPHLQGSELKIKRSFNQLYFLRKRLQLAEKEIFPSETENHGHLPLKNEQLLGIKRIFNCRYQLIQICIEFENLDIVRKQLQPAKEGVPFPEVGIQEFDLLDTQFNNKQVFNRIYYLKRQLQLAEKEIFFLEKDSQTPKTDNPELALTEKQILAIKRVFNIQYHLEQTCAELKTIDNIGKQLQFAENGIPFPEAENQHADTNTKSLFNSLKRQSAEKVVPFPEIEDAELAQLEIHQVIAVKRIFNSLYHLEQICIQLESLDQKSSQSLYVYHLIQAKNHVDELVTHAKTLARDPHLSLFAAELKEKGLAIYQAFAEQQENYVVGSEEVELKDPKYQGKVVQYSGLWYTLRSFMLIPEHIKAAVQNEELSANTKDHVNQRTKQAALNIEAIIVSSNSYFQLFLQTPTMYRLYKELKAKLEQFTHLSHSAAMDHLEELSHDLFVRILITTDEWEDKLGLRPGLLSDPMKALLDEFHKGLLEHLHLNSQEHLALLSSHAPLNYRIEAAKNRKQIATGLLKRDDALITSNIDDLDIDKERLLTLPLNSKITLLKLFTNEVNTYNHSNHILPASPLVQEILSARLVKLYKLLQPLLLAEQNRLNLISRPIETKHQTIESLLQQEVPLPPMAEDKSKNEEQEIELNGEKNKEESQLDEEGYIIEFKSDKFVTKEDGVIELELDDFSPSKSSSEALASSTKQKPAELKNIVYIANAVLSHYQGCKNSIEFEIATANERIAYLEECIGIQEKESEKYRLEYTKHVFERELTEIISDNRDYHYTRAEYNSLLQAFLQTYAIEIIQQSQYKQDINAEVKSLLAVKAEEFERINGAKFIQLEAVRKALAQFDIYFSNAPKTNENRDNENGTLKKSYFFETKDTLRAKIRLIDNLTTIAESNRPVEERLAEIAFEVKKPIFVATMHRHRHYNTLSFAWIGQCIISLLSALHLYTPKYKLLFQRLEKAATHAPTTEPATANSVYIAANRLGIFAPANSAVSEPPLPEPIVAAPSNELSTVP